MKNYLLTVFAIISIWSLLWFGITYADWSCKHPMSGYYFDQVYKRIPFKSYFWWDGYIYLGLMFLGIVTVYFTVNYLNKKYENADDTEHHAQSFYE